MLFQAYCIPPRPRVANFREMKFGTRRSRRHRCRGGGERRGGVPLPSRLGGLGERCELPQRGPGRSPDRIQMHFLHILGSQTGSSRRKNTTFSAGTGLKGVEADPRPKFSATSGVILIQWGVKPPTNRTLGTPPPPKKNRQNIFGQLLCKIRSFSGNYHKHSGVLIIFRARVM